MKIPNGGSKTSKMKNGRGERHVGCILVTLRSERVLLLELYEDVQCLSVRDYNLKTDKAHETVETKILS